MNYLNIYLQIGMLYGIICFCKNLVRVFRRRYREHKWHLNYLNKREDGYERIYAYYKEDCKIWIKDYLPLLLKLLLNIAIWPLSIFMNM